MCLMTTANRPSDHWKEILRTLQSTVPSSTSLSQAIQSLSPTPTAASTFLIGVAASRHDSPPDCGAVAHASCSVLLKAMRTTPSAAAAIMTILCVVWQLASYSLICLHVTLLQSRPLCSASAAIACSTQRALQFLRVF
jgi:hypothetical protein